MSDTLELIDIDPKMLEDIRIECEWSAECSEEAKWLAVATCCGFEIALCPEHKKWEQDYMHMWFVGAKCKHCSSPWDIENRVRWERL